MKAVNTKTLGFTLIELMVVVAVIGILAAIAYPSYQKYVLKSQRADAHDSLMRIQLQQERYRANHPSYSTELTALAGIDSNISDDEHYQLALDDVSASGYTVTATPLSGGRQAKDVCTSISLEVSGGSAERKGDPSKDECW